MPKIKHKHKMLKILDNKNYIYGVFRSTREGRIAAEEYLKKISKTNKEALEIKLV